MSISDPKGWPDIFSRPFVDWTFGEHPEERPSVSEVRRMHNKVQRKKARKKGRAQRAARRKQRKR